MQKYIIPLVQRVVSTKLTLLSVRHSISPRLSMNTFPMLEESLCSTVHFYISFFFVSFSCQAIGARTINGNCWSVRMKMTRRGRRFSTLRYDGFIDKLASRDNFEQWNLLSPECMRATWSHGFLCIYPRLQVRTVLMPSTPTPVSGTRAAF